MIVSFGCVLLFAEPAVSYGRAVAETASDA